MGLYVLDNVKLYEADEDNLVHLAFGDSVWTGCQVIAHVGPDMGVRVGAGSIRYAGVNRTVAQTDLTVTAADPTNPRIDLVHIPGATGVPAIVAGTAASTPKPPALPASSILVGFVSVAAAAVNIQSANITDRRLIASDGVVGGLDANKPAPGIAGRLYAARDTGTLYHDDGATLVPLGNATQPNLILNGDCGRRTVFGLAMPENFTDLLGFTKLDGGTAPTVSGNALTFGAANNQLAWPASGAGFWWPTKRVSAQFKAVATAGIYQLQGHYIDATNFIRCYMSAGTFYVSKVVANTETVLASVGQALTLNNRYWMELDLQQRSDGQIYVQARLYNSGAASTTKAAATILQIVAISGLLVTDAVFNAAGRVVITSDQATAVWGEQAASPGGVYVETWLPESFTFTFGGSVPLGGQAVGFDEAVDAGPLGRQWALRGYIPAVSRNVLALTTSQPGAAPSTGYAISAYMKTSGKGGSGSIVYMEEDDRDPAGGNNHTGANATQDAGETSWTRKTAVVTTASTARNMLAAIYFNLSGTATGTGYIQLIQFEQGSTTTAWRNAPADDAPAAASVEMGPTTAAATVINTTSTSMAELESRDSAMSFFAPAEGILRIEFEGVWWNNAAGAINGLSFSIDGTLIDHIVRTTAAQATYEAPLHATWTAPVSAGRHRISTIWFVSSNTGTIRCKTSPVRGGVLRVTWSRGK